MTEKTISKIRKTYFKESVEPLTRTVFYKTELNKEEAG